MMQRWRVALLGLCLARFAFAFEPFVIRDIRIEGIQRVEAGTVFGYLPVKVGETMTEETAAAAIRSLTSTSGGSRCARRCATTGSPKAAPTIRR